MKFRQDISYDGTSNFTGANCITGALQHDDTNYGCTFTTRGNATSVTTYANASVPSGGITRTLYYDLVGNLRQADADCCQLEQWTYSATTQFAYPDSVTRGATGGTQLTTNFYYENAYTGLLTSTTDENSKTTQYAYDLMRRLTMVTRPDNAQIIYTYDDTIMTVTVAQPVQGTNVVKQVSYFDGLGRAFRSATLDAGNTVYSKTDVLFDPLGRTWKVTNPYTGQNPPSCPSNCTETRFDGSGRVTKTILPDSNQVTYSYSGSTVTVTDPTGKTRKTDTDALGRLVTVYEPDVNNSNSLTQLTNYSYSVLNALTQVTVPQNVQTRTYNYNDLGRLTSQSTLEGGYWQFTYTNFGLVSQRTDARGVITTYGYDGLNRVQSISYNVGATGVPATSTVNLYYDEGGSAANALGRLTHFTDGVGSETYSYNLLGRTTQVAKLINGTTYTTSYSYNDAGEMTQITYPSGRIVNPSYDAIGRLSQIAGGGTNYTSSYAYNPAFQVTGMNYGNGVAASFGYSADRLQLTSLSYVKGATTLFSLGYGYIPQGGSGNNGQITSITDSVDGGRTVNYTYDALYRLSTALTTGSTHYPQWGLSWTYDRYGNRTAQTVTAGTGPSNSVSIDATTNRITGAPYAYDLNGNMTNDGLNSLTFDAESRLVMSSGSTYSYDGSNLRVKKVTSGTTTVYIFSGSKVIAEYVNGAAPSAPTREYIYSGSALLATIDGSGTKYHMSDHLSARLTTDTNGTVVGQQGHYPFGESWYLTNTTTKWQFTSYERDGESPNDYAILRTCVDRLGRFASPDRIAGVVKNLQSLNRYSYTRNDPVNLIDPLGSTIRCQGFYVIEGTWIVENGRIVDTIIRSVSFLETTCSPDDGGDCARFADLVEGIANETIDSKGVQAFMDRLATTFTEFRAARFEAVVFGGTALEPANTGAQRFGSSGFASSYFEPDWVAPDGRHVPMNQVRHAVGGLIAGYVGISLGRMNSREDPNDLEHGVPDINLNGQTVPMGARIADKNLGTMFGPRRKGPFNVAAAKGLANWIRNTLCAH